MTDTSLGVVITNSTARKAIYGTWLILIVISGAIANAYASIKLQDPTWLTQGQAALTYLGIPVGGLALANAPTKIKAAVVKATPAVQTTAVAAPVTVAPVATPVAPAMI